MSHPYTPYCPTFAYRGRYRYLLTFVAFDRSKVFSSAAAVALVLEQFLRAAEEQQFEILVYCFMPDHVHLVVGGLTDDADLKAFVRLAKQYSGYRYPRTHGRERLWQKGFNDHIVRDDVDLLDRVRYVVNNPVAAGLVKRPQDYRFIGSQRESTEELIAWCRPRIANGPSPDDGG